MNNENEFMEELWSEFKNEVDSHLQIISSGLIEIEKKYTDQRKKIEIIENIYRESHTLKGAARVLNLSFIEKICQGMENIFAIWKNNLKAIQISHFDLLYSAMDIIQELTLHANDVNFKIPEKKINSLIIKLNDDILNHPTQKTSNVKPTFKKENLTTTHTPLHISSSRLGKIFLQSEEMLAIKLILDERTADAYKLEHALLFFKKEWEEVFYNFQNSTEDTKKAILELNHRTQLMFKNFDKQISGFAHQIELDRYSINVRINQLIAETKKMLLLPFSTLLNLFPKMIRNLSHDQGKNVNLLVHGDEIEIDKRILEEIKETLIHILRNSIDHGIETPEERRKNNKPAESILKISITQTRGNEIEIIIADDGRGINKESLKAVAIQRGIISEEEAKQLNDEDTIALIYQSGISTSPILTDLSGRGLGMAIVKDKIEKLGGNIQIHSIFMQGTTIKITLPLMIATYKGVLLQVADQMFVLPTANLEKVLRIPTNDIQSVENRETIHIDDTILALIRLGDILEIPANSELSLENNFIQAVIVNALGNRLALKVDNILQEQEIIIKNFLKPIKRVRNLAGATFLASGKTVPILNIEDIIKSAMKKKCHKTSVGQLHQNNKTTILLVEDSITTRVLLKNILELAGFDVITAVDGVEALLLLKSHNISLIVSDIDMPHMNGLELTQKIRKTKKYENLPIILLTGRESQEDYEKGLDSGANAYVLKSNFDSANILEVIRRLV
jgi:two-component system chemotaxis sensor kinase CheA